MAESSDSKQIALAALHLRLEAADRLLRQPGSLDPQAKQALTELVAELSEAIRSGAVQGPGVVDLAHDTAELTEKLHKEKHVGGLAGVRDRLNEAVLEVDVHHPIIAGLVRRLLDALGNIGI